MDKVEMSGKKAQRERDTYKPELPGPNDTNKNNTKPKNKNLAEKMPNYAIQKVTRQ